MSSASEIPRIISGGNFLEKKSEYVIAMNLYHPSFDELYKNVKQFSEKYAPRRINKTRKRKNRK